jgi:hypothetical protein
MEVWMNASADMHSWRFVATDLLGQVNHENIELMPIFMFYRMDSFGSLLLMALASAARLEPPYEAAAAVMAVFIVWFATALFSLAKKLFELGFWGAPRQRPESSWERCFPPYRSWACTGTWSILFC